MFIEPGTINQHHFFGCVAPKEKMFWETRGYAIRQTSYICDIASSQLRKSACRASLTIIEYRYAHGNWTLRKDVIVNSDVANSNRIMSNSLEPDCNALES